MIHLLDFAASSPPINFTVPAPIINNVMPAPNLWAVFGATLVGGLIGWGGLWITHAFTNSREKDYRLRLGYADFAAACFSLLECEKSRCPILRNIAKYELSIEMENERPRPDQEKIERLQTKIVEAEEKMTPIWETIDELKHEALKAHSLLVMLLAGDQKNIQDLDEIYVRLQAMRPRHFPLRSVPLPSKTEKVRSNGLLSAQMPARDRYAIAQNMELDFFIWLREISAALTPQPLFQWLIGWVWSNLRTPRAKAAAATEAALDQLAGR